MKKISFQHTHQIFHDGTSGYRCVVSSFSIEYLVDHLKAKQFASIPIEKFYQLSSLRPVGTIKDGRLTELTIQAFLKRQEDGEKKEG